MNSFPYVEFPYGRFYTRDSREKLRILLEIFLDILHELSHFYEIGNTEKSDQNSEYWSIELLRRGLDEIYLCYLKEDKTQAQDTNSSNADSEDIDKKYHGVFIHIASGMANIREFYRLSYKSEFD